MRDSGHQKVTGKRGRQRMGVEMGGGIPGVTPCFWGLQDPGMIRPV